MKAIQFSHYGSPDVLEMKDISPPVISDKQVLIETAAVSINPFDVKLRQGRRKETIPLRLPMTIGGDFSGIIIATGDQIYGQAMSIKNSAGTFAQQIAANPKFIARKPQSIGFEQAAALPLVGTSAIQAIEELINLQPGQRILIHGGSGGIGSIAIQMAKMHRAFIAVTASAKNEKLVKDLGADQFIDYHREPFEKNIQGFDAVFDTVGGDVTNRSLTVLRPGGMMVTMIGQPDQEKAKQLGVTAIVQQTVTNTQRLDRLTELVDEKTIRPIVDRIFPFDQFRDAFRYWENNHPSGKVVIKVSHSWLF